MKSSISFAGGFLGPRHNDGVFHTYDEKKAKKIVKEEKKKNSNLSEVYVGLEGDWDCNNDLLWDGKFQKPDFYKSSCWAKPSLLFIYEDGSERDGGFCYIDIKQS